MQRHLLPLLPMALAGPLMAQTPWPPLCIQDADWTSGTHHTAVTQPIEAPCSPAAPYSASATADADLVSATEVHLADGFHAGDFSGNGQFHAHIDEALGAPADLVLISPDPATHVVDGIVHVEKWEKLEVGLRLPQEYLDAVDRFFAHYYSFGTDTVATPSSVDSTYDLNPYADDSLQLVMTVTSPSGIQRMQWGFYMREARWYPTVLNTPLPFAQRQVYPDHPLDPYRIRFRFSPGEEGLWTFAISVAAPRTRTLANIPLPAIHYSGYSFSCDAPLADNHGFLHVNPNNHRLLRFDDGTPFLGLGMNLTDIRHAYLTNTSGLVDWWYKYYWRDSELITKSMRQLHEVGGNYIRMMFLRELWSLEWVNAGVYDSYYAASPCTNGGGIIGPGNCQCNAWDFDRILDSARVNDLYLQLNIDPNCPGRSGESTGWGNHPYVAHFLDPARDTATGLYDMKRFFFTPGQNGEPQYDSGVFYHWKRRYKYLMARWGYSVNIAAIEPFNEIDLILGYEGDSLVADDICDENIGYWPTDTALPSTMDHWFTKMAEYVRGTQLPEDVSASPLGDTTRLFVASYADCDPWKPGADNYYLPFSNPAVDLMDAHRYIGPTLAQMNTPDVALRDVNDAANGFHSAFPTYNAQPEERKPFTNGESNYTTRMTFDAWENDEIEKVFRNYDVSFHNELWAGAFSGKWTTGNTWLWERVFWWDESLPKPPSDPNNPFPLNPFQPFTSLLDSSNILCVAGDSIHVRNRTLYHHFKPLADMLNNADWQGYDFFNGGYNPHSVRDYSHRIESYYLMNADQNLAIGWVHNLNAWVMNSYYLASGDSTQNYLGCSAPYVDWHVLPGFQPGVDYHVTWFPTRMDTTALPVNYVDTTDNGFVTLEMSTSPLGGVLSTSLDTLHSDYAFIISMNPVHRSQAVAHEDPAPAKSEWSFVAYPNPANDVVFLLTPDTAPKEIAIHDLTGRRIRAWNGLTGTRHQIPIGSLSKGTYFLRVTEGAKSGTKKLIID